MIKEKKTKFGQQNNHCNDLKKKTKKIKTKTIRMIKIET